MINFFVTKAAGFCIREYLLARGAPIAHRVKVVEYDDLSRLEAVSVGAAIFAAVDQIGLAAKAASRVYDQIAAVTARALNDPRSVLCRFELLRRLHDSGCNRFTCIRASDDPAALKYPVFIRQEDQHTGSLTPLLADRRALDQALAGLMWRGLRPSKLLIVEFCDTVAADGLYRKYSAMKIGDAIVPRHLHISRDWVTKSQSNLADEESLREELHYFENHPHERWLREVFAIARIDYGRIDYGMYRGQPQVWEINTNPMLGSRLNRAPRPDSEPPSRVREQSRRLAHDRMLAAFKELDRPGDEQLLPIAIGRTLRARTNVEAWTHRWDLVANVHHALSHSRLRPLLERARPAMRRIAPAIARLTARRSPRDIRL